MESYAVKQVTFDCWGSGTGWVAREFNGVIDEVKIYNRALLDQEIKVLYDSTK